MRRHTGHTGLYLGLSFLLLFACTTIGLAKEITFLAVGYSSGLMNYVQQEVIPTFRARHNADVTMMTADWNTRMDRIVVLTAGGTPPDVVVTGFYSPYEEGSIGLLEPLDRYLERWKYTSRFPRQLWHALSWQGKVMVMPQNVAPRAVGYNKELYAQSGLDPDRPPQAWDELIQYTRRLTRVDDDRVAVRGFSMTTTAAGAAQQLFWFMRQAGLTEIDTSTFTTRLTDPKALAALQMLQELYEAGQSNLPIQSGGFNRGRIAMQYSNPQQMPSMMAADPDLLLKNFALFAPRQTPSSPPVVHLFTDGLAIPSASRNKDLAWEFISLLSSDDVLVDIQRIEGFFGGRTDMLQRMMSVQPRIDLWYDLFQHMQASVIPPPRNTSQQELGNLILQVYRMQMAPLAALEQGQAVWNRLLDDWKGSVRQ
ncbi:MAG: extracellular solute-binding protein [Limnochordia bacterium]|jgi:ABC-type glycerol-3-phosphate transport system substrate-binding protein